MYKTVITQFLRLYQWLLHLYPTTHYEEYGNLTRDMAHEILWDAVKKTGWRGLVCAMIRLILDLTQSISREQIDYQKGGLIPVLYTLKNNPKKLLLNLIVLMLGIALLPLLEVFQLIASLVGPLLFVVCIWQIQRDLPTNLHIVRSVVGFGLLGPILIIGQWLFTSYQIEFIDLFPIWLQGLSIGGVLLSTVLIVHWFSKRAKLPTLPVTIIVLAILARYSDLDYFTFEMGDIIHFLSLITIPVIILWWSLIRNSTIRRNGVLILWTVVMLTIIGLNLYGRHVIGGTNHIGLHLHAPIYALTSIIVLWIASTLPNPHENTSPEPFVGQPI